MVLDLFTCVGGVDSDRNGRSLVDVRKKGDVSGGTEEKRVGKKGGVGIQQGL